MLSNTDDSPMHCLKSNLKCLSFLPLIFFSTSRNEAKALQKPIKLFIFLPKSFMFLLLLCHFYSFMSVFFSILFHSLTSALKAEEGEK